LAQFDRNRRVDGHHPLSVTRSSERRRGWLLAAGALLLAAVWFGPRWLSTPAPPEPEARPVRTSSVSPVRTSSVRETPAPVRHTSVPPPAPRADPSAPSEPIESDDALEEEPRRPHPITPQHERIFRENNLIGALNDAMDREDVPRLRRLNAEYREEYPEEEAQLVQEGYDIIADCIEHKAPRAEEAGRRFWQDHRASNLRRYVRRHCFTN
jgi:hypothetical protein